MQLARYPSTECEGCVTHVYRQTLQHEVLEGKWVCLCIWNNAPFPFGLLYCIGCVIYVNVYIANVIQLSTHSVFYVFGSLGALCCLI